MPASSALLLYPFDAFSSRESVSASLEKRFA
jgi:hypothetical protein